MKINKLLLVSVSLLILIIGVGCLYAASIHQPSSPTQASPESQALQSGLGGGLGGGLGSEKPASALGSGLGGGLGGGLGSEKPASTLGSSISEPSFDDYINFDEILNPSGWNIWNDPDPLQ